MARGDSELLKQVLEKLMYLDPPIKKFPVTPEDAAMAVYFVDLKDVCYITTKSDQGREERVAHSPRLACLESPYLLGF